MASSRFEVPVEDRCPQPSRLKPLKDLDIYAKYHAVRMGGDFFDAHVTSLRLVFLLTDIAGERGEALAIAADVQDTFRKRSEQLLGPVDANESEAMAILVQDVNAALLDAAQGVRLAPTFIGCYNLALGVLTFINAGCQPAFFRDAESTRVLEGGGLPLGLFTHLTHEPAVQAFEPGAKLLLVTKGVIESRRGKTEFGAERVIDVLRSCDTDAAAAVCEATLEAVDAFRDHPSSRVHNLLNLKKAETHEDITVVSLVRPSQAEQRT